MLRSIVGCGKSATSAFLHGGASHRMVTPPWQRCRTGSAPTSRRRHRACSLWSRSPLRELAVGYCGLVENSVGHPEEPELAFEFLRDHWGRGFATEASRAIVDRAAAIGYVYLASTVREWNTASFKVLDKLGFELTGEREHDAVHGDSLLLRKRL